MCVGCNSTEFDVVKVASCTASSELMRYPRDRHYRCDRTLDGNPDTKWVTEKGQYPASVAGGGECEGSWIEMKFEQRYVPSPPPARARAAAAHTHRAHIFPRVALASS